MPDSFSISPSPEGPVLSSGGKPLMHPGQPKSRAEETARRQKIQNQTLVLVPSPLFGYGLDALLENLPPESRILCVEHDENLMAASLRHFPARLAADPRVAFARAETPRQAAGLVTQKFGLHLFRRVVTVPLTRGYTLFPDFYRALAENLLDAVQVYWRNRMTTLHMGRLWMGNLFTNMALLPAFQPITEMVFRRPVAVTGAGESLEKHLPFLAARRESLSIISVDTALPVLRAAGIKPDLVIIAEAQFANMYDFQGFTDWSIPAAADITSYPGILRRFTGPRYVFLSRFTELAWFAREDVKSVLPPLIPPLGSVGVMALYLALRAAAEKEPVFLAGLDFRYTPGKPHAKGSPTHSLFLAGQNRLSFPRYLASWYGRPRENAPLAGGGTAPADAVLASYRKPMRDIAAGRKNIFCLESAGLDLEIPVISRGEADTLLTRSRGGSRTAAECPPATAQKNARTISAAADDFRRAQAAELEAIAASPALNEEALKKNDFLFLDCPENPPWPTGEAGFIRRVRERAAWYAGRLRKGDEIPRG